jgi:cyclophilin family peptidyl-prolyl cis-trans isomerase
MKEFVGFVWQADHHQCQELRCCISAKRSCRGVHALEMKRADARLLQAICQRSSVMRAREVLIVAILMLATPARADDGAVADPTVRIETSLGDITLQLDQVHAPVTVGNFLRYVNEGHFDGTVVYRVEPGFVIQAGSWDADLQVRPTHEPIALEAANGLSNVRGSVAMARSDEPASATAEFFINLADNHALDHAPSDLSNNTGYAVFGKVIAGMDVVDKIASVPRGDHGPMPGAAPVEPIVIRKVFVLPSGEP